MSVIRVPITFSAHEVDLIEHLEKQDIPKATYIKQLIRQDMNKSNNNTVDEKIIERTVEKVLAKKGIDIKAIEKEEKIEGKPLDDGGLEF